MKIWVQYFLIILSVVSCFGSPAYSQGKGYYGLSFQSYDIPPEKRTSLIIGQKQPLSLGDDFKIAFDLRFVPDQTVYFGYVFRLVNQQGQRINLLYDQKGQLFRLTINGKYGPQFFPKTKDLLFNEWNHFEFRFQKDSIICSLNHKRLGAMYLHLVDDHYDLVFGGGSDGFFFATDVPPMKLKNVMIEQKGKLKYNWPLKEGNDNNTIDEIQGEKAVVANPVWLIQVHSHWKLLHEKVYKGNVTVTFDPDQEELYVVAADSIFRFTVNNNQDLTKEVYPSNNHRLFLGNHSLFNPVDHKLYDYYIDLHSISSYSFTDGNWDRSYDSVQYTEYSQANRIFSPQENALYVIGGYGQMRYKNTIQRYSFQSNTWDTLKPKGDYFSPRYLASAAMKGDSIYILGGYGSLTGDQLLDPGYAYDFMVYDIKNNRFTKRFSLKRPDSALVFGSSMIIDTTTNSYYALGFSNERYDSHLQLIQGSLQRPEYHSVADVIPFSFQDVLSEADLFWCPKSQKLLAVTLIITKNKSTSVAIYSIAFPPNALSSDVDKGKSPVFSFLVDHKWVFIFILLAIILFITYLQLRRNKKVQLKGVATKQVSELRRDGTEETDHQSMLQDTNEEIGANKMVEKEDQSGLEPLNPLVAVDSLENLNPPDMELELESHASIQLFGAFELLDRDENPLTPQFSPLLKELFLIILLNTIVQKTGISSKKLNEIFWRSKSDKDANNNRSVNIAKLKSILDKVDSLTVVNEHSKWFVRYDPSVVQVDLAEFQDLVASEGKVDRYKISKVLAYLQKGGLLKHTEYDWLDDFKSKISNLVIDKLVDLTGYLTPAKDADTLLKIANCIFSFDPINEQALSLKCKALASIGRHSLAQSTYQHYSKEYEKMYGEPFGIAFNDIVTGE